MLIHRTKEGLDFESSAYCLVPWCTYTKNETFVHQQVGLCILGKHKIEHNHR